MSEIAIKVENLYKQYNIGEIGTGTLSHDLNRFWYKIRGKADPYTKLGEINDRTVRSDSGIVNVLNDINFEIKKGEILGIIGKNGAGKSTLLKVLSKVTGPTRGQIFLNGRVASLLEVGTGFHPELTGRENIYLNGAILGMKKSEVTRKLDEIVDFAGVAKYLDTPVKRYSSGMMVRLGFAVAAHLDPEILIVDEVLAVGDAEFQRKAIGKMQDVRDEGGRTVIFVSHNMATIKQLCPNSIVLNQGQIEFLGGTTKAISKYFTDHLVQSAVSWQLTDNLSEKLQNPYFFLKKLSLTLNGEELTSDSISPEVDSLTLVIEGEVEKLDSRLGIGFVLRDEYGNILLSNKHTDLYEKDKIVLHKGYNKLEVSFPTNYLNEGIYYLDFNSGLWGIGMIQSADKNNVSIKFKIEGLKGDSTYLQKRRDCILAPYLRWKSTGSH